MVQPEPMSEVTQTKKNPKVDPAAVRHCLGDHGHCPKPVVAQGRCASHYRRHLRGGSDDAPVLAHRGDLVPLCLRVTEPTVKELEKAGGGYSVGAKVLEAWAAQQAQAKAKKKS